MWFGLKPTFIRENKEELPLLLQEITILKLSNPIIMLKKDFFNQNLFLYFLDYKRIFHKELIV